MKRPAILDEDVVVVPVEAKAETEETIKEFGHWHHLNEMTIAKGMVPSDSEIDIEVMAFNKIKRAMLSASPYPTAWDDVRKYVEGLEKEVDRLKFLVEWGEAFCDMKHPDTARAESAEARIADLEKRLADADVVIEPFSKWIVPDQDPTSVSGWIFGVRPSDDDFRAARAYMEGK